ncbi:MAG: hypothetical protein H0X62_13215 [Bacteroidetes bacterium]|nr:hypothetical protein [Bacteroidota bacterium]
MKVFIFCSLLFIFITFKHSLAQDTIHNRMVEVYHPVVNFFDGTSINWKLGNAIGLSYSKFNPDLKHGYNLSLILYNRWYEIELPPLSLRPGDLTRRKMALISSGYNYRLLQTGNFIFYGLANVTARLGEEQVHAGYPSIAEQWVYSRGLLDLGVSTGLKVTAPLPYRFTIGFEPLYSFFILRYSKGKEYDFEVVPHSNYFN